MSSAPGHQSPAVSEGEKRSEPSVVVQEITSGVVIPDGGVQAWATVAGSFLIMFCGFGYASSFGVYQDFYVRTYLVNSSSSAISWIGSVNIFIVLAGGFISGRLHDRGYFYPLMWGGSFLIVLSLFTLSLARPNQFYQVFLAHGVANGIGAGMTYVPCVAIISHHFQKRRALAMTIVASGSSLGAVIHPIMLNHTLHSRLGFGNAVRASAGLISGLLLLACLLMRTRLPPSKQPLNLWQTLRKAGHDKAYLVGTLGLAIFTTGYYYPLFYLQLNAIQHGLDPTFAFYALVIMNAASAVGRILPGILSHRVGVKAMVTVASGLGSILILAMIAMHDMASVVSIGVLYGFFAGGVATLMGPLFTVLTDDMSELGTRMGAAFAFSGVGILLGTSRGPGGEQQRSTNGFVGSIGPPVDGVLLTSDFIWWRPALFSGVMAGCGFCCFLVVLIIHKPKIICNVAEPDVEAPDNKV
ncbi:MFS general substrate transporter [Mycena venus]|uniref:MFS general substrate transporter n=1 Tax=Mycena venus TaxID=2733690 RepID=A0A8H6Z1L9_9AGAR|nr:MFS general substrate transporter [Mycena venus]